MANNLPREHDKHRGSFGVCVRRCDKVGPEVPLSSTEPDSGTGGASSSTKADSEGSTRPDSS
eukprot:400865-Lingulodinium_polyedra.AAC.1